MLANVIGFPLLLLILLFPNTLQMVKLPLMLILLLGLTLKRGKCFRFDSKQLLWIGVYVLSNLFYICYGLILGNPAPLKYLLVYSLWPVVFFYITQFIDVYTFYKISKVFTYTLLLLNVIGVVAFWGLNLFGLSEFLMFKPLVKPGFPFLGITSPVITTYIFLYFYNLTIMILSIDNHNKIYKFNTYFGLLFILFTARRIIYIDIVLAILIIAVLTLKSWRLRRIATPRLVKLSMGTVVVLVMIMSYIASIVSFSFEDLFLLVENAFGDNSTTDPRVEQSIALLKGWSERPFFGNGTGVNASVVRSEVPGMYELSYHAMLFERGIIGVLIYALLYISYNVKCINLIGKIQFDNKYIIAYIVALSVFMMSNATNPYLYAFDFLWILFFGFIFINRYFKPLKSAGY